MTSMNLSSENSTSFSSQHPDIFSVITTTAVRDLGLTVVASSIGHKTKDGCLVVDQKFNPVDNPANIVSKQTYLWISTINYAVIIPVLFLLGAPGNILSAAVFYRLGLKERINLNVFCLSLADLVIIFITVCVGIEKTYRSLVGPFNFFIKTFPGLTGFMWVSMFLSAVIAAERCFCVVSPLRAQRMLSTRTLAVVIFFASAILMGGMFAIVGPKLTEACIFDVHTNTTSLTVSVTDYYMEHRKILDIFDVFVYAMGLPSIFLAIVIITTIITTAKLKSTLKWRQQSSSASGVQTTSNSETQMVALTWMLVATSVLFVVCTCPIVILQMCFYFIEELRLGGLYHNVSELSWSFIDVLRCVNCSLNFFIYFKMGSRFRQTLRQLVTCKEISRSMSNSDNVGSTIVSEHSRKGVPTLSDQKDFARY